MTRSDFIMMSLIKLFPHKDIKFIQIQTIRLINELNTLYKSTRY